MDRDLLKEVDPGMFQEQMDAGTPLGGWILDAPGTDECRAAQLALQNP